MSKPKKDAEPAPIIPGTARTLFRFFLILLIAAGILFLIRYAFLKA
jgi:hypothetical protein